MEPGSVERRFVRSKPGRGRARAAAKFVEGLGRTRDQGLTSRPTPNRDLDDLRIVKNDPVLLWRLSGNAVKRLLPEGQHLVELVTADDDRAELRFLKLSGKDRRNSRFF